MASGNTLCVFAPQDNEPPSSNPATPNLRNGHPKLDFDAAAATEDAIFTSVLPRHYAGGGLTITLVWAGTSATTGDVVWNTAIERMDTGTDTDADSFATANSATATTSGTSGAPIYTTIAHTSGAQMDSLAAGEAFRLKVSRLGSNGSDTMAGDAELLAVEIKET